MKCKVFYFWLDEDDRKGQPLHNWEVQAEMDAFLGSLTREQIVSVTQSSASCMEIGSNMVNRTTIVIIYEPSA